MSSIALCIPAFNASIYIDRLLLSAKNQLVKFDEILVYDDCSTDNTAEIAIMYGAKVIKGNTNMGCSYGKNILAKNVKSDWIHFHDADDDLLFDFTTQTHRWIEEFGDLFDVLILNFKYIDYKSGAFLGSANHNKDELNQDPLKYAIENKIVNFGLYKRVSFLKAGGFDLDPDVLYNEDNAFHQNLAKKGLTFDYLPHITCINYLYNKSMSKSNLLKCSRSTFHVLKKTSINYGTIYSKELAKAVWNNIPILASQQDWGYVRQSISLCKKLGFSYFQEQNYLFNFLAYGNLFGAIWLREKLIRLFKPHLRQ